MKPILVIVHVFYPNLWPELKKCIQNVQSYPFELYVTMVEKNPDVEKDILKSFPSAHIEIVDGRGFDVGPFIHILNKINLDNYSYIVKLHTKRDLAENNNGFRNMHSDIWRNNLLLPYQSKEIFHAYIENFAKYPQVGMQGYYKLFVKNNWFQDKLLDKDSYINFRKFLQSRNLEEIPFQYIAGTIFIAKAELFKYIQNLKLTISDFSRSNRQEKGDMAHIFERFFGYIIYAQNHIVRDTLVSEEKESSFHKKIFIRLIVKKIIRFFYQKKVTKSGKLRIKICKIPVYGGKA